MIPQNAKLVRTLITWALVVLALGICLYQVRSCKGKDTGSTPPDQKEQPTIQECAITTIDIIPAGTGGTIKGHWEKRPNGKIHAWAEFKHSYKLMSASSPLGVGFWSKFEFTLDPITGQGGWSQTVPKSSGEIVGARIPGSNAWEIARKMNGKFVEKFTFTPL